MTNGKHPEPNLNFGDEVPADDLLRCDAVACVPTFKCKGGNLRYQSPFCFHPASLDPIAIQNGRNAAADEVTNPHPVQGTNKEQE